MLDRKVAYSGPLLVISLWNHHDLPIVRSVIAPQRDQIHQN